MLTTCPDCGKSISMQAASCPSCGRPNVQRKTLESLMPKGNCPMCHSGFLIRMDAGSRGTAFGQGNLIGAFSKSMRCGNCGYLA